MQVDTLQGYVNNEYPTKTARKSYSKSTLKHKTSTQDTYFTKLPPLDSSREQTSVSKAAFEDTDGSETETVLDTPTGWADTYTLLRRSDTWANNHSAPGNNPIFRSRLSLPPLPQHDESMALVANRKANVHATKRKTFSGYEISSDDDEEDLPEGQVQFLERQLQQLHKNMAQQEEREIHLRQQLESALRPKESTNSEEPLGLYQSTFQQLNSLADERLMSRTAPDRYRRGSFWNDYQNAWSGSEIDHLFSLTSQDANEEVSKTESSPNSSVTTHTSKETKSGDELRRLKAIVCNFRDTIGLTGTDTPVQATSCLKQQSNLMEYDAFDPSSVEAGVKWYKSQHAAFCSQILTYLDEWIDRDTTNKQAMADGVLKKQGDRSVLGRTNEEISLETISLRNQNLSLVHALQKLQGHHAALSASLKKNKRENTKLQVRIQKIETSLSKHKEQTINNVSVPSIPVKADIIPIAQWKKAQDEWSKKIESEREQSESTIAALNKSMTESLEEKEEIEQTLDAMRTEMETMLEELEESRQESERFRDQANGLRSDLDLLSKMDDEHKSDHVLYLLQTEAQAQINEMEKETKRQDLVIKDLRNDLRTIESLYREAKQAKATQDKELGRLQSIRERAAEVDIQRKTLEAKLFEAEKLKAEAELKEEMVKAQTKQLQEDFKDSITNLQTQLDEAKNELAARRPNGTDNEAASIEKALERAVAERDAELSKLQKTLEQTERKMAHQEASYITRQEQEKAAWKVLIEEQSGLEHQRNLDIFKVQHSRDIREMACQIADLESEIESLERRHSEESSHFAIIKREQTAIEEKARLEKVEWITVERELRQSIVVLEQKTIGLEGETVRLYGKNLDLAHRLGQMDP
ncbi:hypothetical protein J3Q64DRAFT_1734302 [Phycomyces blakesleeanus]|uniref:Up-regulated during septation protein 1 domain-containing protein n=1 Tax=Phycomyces blakesleeanus TaxID=4837 RepID=A0ABR3B2Z1_PHYBL